MIGFGSRVGGKGAAEGWDWDEGPEIEEDAEDELEKDPEVALAVEGPGERAGM